MAINDDITWRLRLDTSDAQMAAQQQMMNQQQLMQNIAQMQAASSSMSAMPYMNQMSAQGIMARQVMGQLGNYGGADFGTQGMLNAGMAGMYGENLFGINQRGLYQAAPYQPPSGILDRPLDIGYRPDYYEAVKQDISGKIGRNIIAPMGIPGGENLGQPGYGLPIDQSLTRSSQIYGTMRGLQKTEFWNRVYEDAIPAGLNIAAGALALTPFGGVAAGVYGASQVYSATVGAIAEQRDDYGAMRDYFRDATASTMRGIRGGGASFADQNKFMQAAANMGQQDKFFISEDIARLEKLSFELGFQQSSGDVEKAISVLDNIRQSIKGMTSVGMKLADTTRTMRELSSMGISPGEDPGRAIGMTHRLNTEAFTAGMSLNDMLDRTYQASNMFAQQGIALNQGGRIHAANLGLANSVIASGGLSYDQIQFYGGKEGLANATTQAMESMNRSPLGQMALLGMLRDPGIRQGMMDGSANAMDILGQGLGNMSPQEYLNLQYRKPELTKDLDPTMLGLGQMNLQIQTLKQTLGLGAEDKIDPGILMTYFGENARPMINMMENAPQAYEFQMQSIRDKAATAVKESSRQAPGLSDPKAYFANLKEEVFGDKGYFGNWSAESWASHETEVIESKYNEWMEALNPDEKGLSFRGDMNRVERARALSKKGAGSEGLNRLDKALVTDLKKEVGSNAFLKDLVDSEEVNRRRTFNKIDDAINQGVTGDVSRTVTSDQIQDAVSNIKKTGIVSSSDESVIKAAAQQGLLSEQDKEAIAKAKSTVTDAAYLNADKLREQSTNMRTFMAEGFTGTDKETTNKAKERLRDMSLDERKTLANAVGFSSDFKDATLKTAQAMYGKDKIKSYEDVLALDPIKQAELGAFTKGLSTTAGVDEGAAANINKRFADMNKEGTGDTKARVLKELQTETDTALKDLRGSLSELGGVTTSGKMSRREAEVASETIKVGLLNKIGQSDSALQDAAKDGSLYSLVSADKKKDLQALIDKGDLKGARELVTSNATSRRKDLVSKVKGDESLGLLFDQTESSVAGKEFSASGVKNFLDKENKFNEKYANEAGVTGRIGTEQGKILANMFADVDDVTATKGLAAIEALRKGEGSAIEVFNALGNNSQYKGVAGFSKDLLEAKASGKAIDVTKQQEIARTKFKGLSKDEQKSLDALIQDIASNKTTVAEAGTELANVIANTTYNETGAAFKNTGGTMGARGASAIQQETRSLNQQAKMMSEIGDQIEILPKSLKESTEKLTQAFGSANDEGTYVNAVVKNTRAIEKLSEVMVQRADKGGK